MSEWIKTHWFLIVAFATMTTAWGQQQQKITTLEQAIVLHRVQSDKIDDLKLQAARQDEQLKSIKATQAKMDANIEKLLERRR